MRVKSILALFGVIILALLCTQNVFGNTVNLYTGQHVESFPLANLQGTGGLSANIAISYSGNVSRIARTPNYMAQVSPYGLGFTMSEQAVISDHKGTASMADDKYMLTFGGMTALKQLVADTFVAMNGNEWKIIRNVDTTVTDIPIVTGWTVITENGTIHRFGNFSDTSYHATHNILRYGENVGNGATDDDESYPIRWDLSIVHDPDTLHWVKFKYLQEIDSLVVMDTTTGSSSYSSPYTRASYLEEISLSDDRQISIEYAPREDYQQMFNINVYEYYSTKKTYKIRVFGRNDDTLSIIKFDYSYLNADRDSTFKKLVLTSIARYSGDGDDTLSTTRFTYYSDTSDVAFGAIKEIINPSGSIKEINYKELSSSENLSAPHSELYDTSTTSTTGKNDTYMANRMIYYEIVDSVKVGYWDGRWISDTTGLSGDELEDVPALSPAGWIAYYDRSEDSIIVKWWKGGFWETEALTDKISFSSGQRESVHLYAGDDCFLVCVIDSVYVNPIYESIIKKIYYYHYDGNDWTGSEVASPVSPKRFKGDIQLNGRFFAAAVRESGVGPDGRIYYGLYDFAGDSLVIDSVDHDAWPYLREDTSHIATGHNYLGHFNYDSTHIVRWNGSSWDNYDYDADSNFAVRGITGHRNGCTWIEEKPAYPDSTLIKTLNFKALDVIIDTLLAAGTFMVGGNLNQSSHSLESITSPYIGTTSLYTLYEWNGISWTFVDSVYFDSQLQDSLQSLLLEPSYNIANIDASENHYLLRSERYIGNGVWGDIDTLFYSDLRPSVSDNYFIYTDTTNTNDSIYLIHYDDFRYVGDYETRGIIDHPQMGDSNNVIMANPGGFYINQHYGGKFTLHAHAMVDKYFKDSIPLVVVDSVYWYEYFDAPDTTVRSYNFYAGLTDASGGSPRFTKSEISTPFFNGDSPDGYAVTYFYNDIGDSIFTDGHVAAYCTIPNMDSLTVSETDDTTLFYGVRNGGHWLDGQPYLMYAYTVGSGVEELVDYTYNYYQFYDSPHSDSVSDLYRMRLSKTITRTASIEDTTVYFYDSHNGMLEEIKSPHKGGDSLITQITYAFEDVVDTATARMMKEDNAISQVLEKSSSHYDASETSTILLAKSRQSYEKIKNWMPTKSYTWRDLDSQSDTLFTFRAGAVDSLGRVYGVVNIDGDTAWVKFDKDSLKTVGAGSNCSYEEFLIQDFEIIGNWDGWFNMTYAGLIEDDDSIVFTGTYSKKLLDNSGSSDYNLGPFRKIYKTDLTDSLYYFSLWVRSNWDVTIWAKCTNTAKGDTIGNGGKFVQFSGLDSLSWQKVEGFFDLSDIYWDSLDYVVVQVSLDNDPSGDGIANFDNFRFHPLKSRVATKVYNNTGMVSSKLGLNNIPIRFEYDEFHRLVETKNYEDSTLAYNEYYSPNHIDVNLITEARIEDPDVGEDRDTLVIENFSQNVDYTLFVDQAEILTATAVDAWIIWNRVDIATDTLVDSIHCNLLCDTATIGTFWASPGDTIIVYAKKASGGGGGGGDGPGSDWVIYAKALADDYTYDYLNPEYSKTISFDEEGDSVVSVTYVDSYGRALQKRKTQFNDETEAAWVLPAGDYDARGRATLAYKPYYDLVDDAGVLDYTAPDDILTEINDYYDGTNAPDCDDRPYSQVQYYDDIKGRLKKGALPGDSLTYWIDTNHVYLYEYDINTTDDVFISTVTDPDSVVTKTVADLWGYYALDTAFYTDNTGSPAKVVTRANMNILGQIEDVYVGNGTDSVLIRKYDYNDLGQMTKEWRIDHDTTSMIYDKAGRLRFVLNELRRANGEFIYFKYDQFGRQIEEGVCDTLRNDSLFFAQSFADDPEFPTSNLPITVKYQWRYDYDLNVDSSVNYGALAKTQNGDSTYYKQFFYFPFDYKDSTEVQLLINNGDKKSLVHEYDGISGQIERFRFYPYESTTAARSHEYLYDKSGRLKSIRERDLDSLYEYNRDYAAYEFDAGGRVTKATLGDYLLDADDYHAQAMNYTYNAQGWLTAINDPDEVIGQLTGRGDTTHFGMELTYGATYFNGRVDSIVSKNSKSGGVQYLGFGYTYNELGWLTKADIYHTTLDSLTREYVYNYLGNRDSTKYYTKSTSTQDDTDYDYDATAGSSKLIGFDGTTDRYYDEVGNLVADSGKNVTDMTYDYRNMLTYAETDQTYVDAPNNKSYFDYDQNSMRIRKRDRYYWRERVIEPPEDDGPGEDGPGGGGWSYYNEWTENHYLYDGRSLIAVFDSSDGEDSYYINGIGGPVAVLDKNDTSKRYYFLKDQIGNTRVMVDDTGKVVEYTNYYPFGETMEDWSVYKEDLKFSGKEWDDFRTFEYNYFGARYYDPTVGTFTTVDKMAQFVSGYNYCGNNPISNIDPDGNESVCFTITTNIRFSEWQFVGLYSDASRPSMIFQEVNIVEISKTMTYCEEWEPRGGPITEDPNAVEPGQVYGGFVGPPEPEYQWEGYSSMDEAIADMGKHEWQPTERERNEAANARIVADQKQKERNRRGGPPTKNNNGGGIEAPSLLNIGKTSDWLYPKKNTSAKGTNSKSSWLSDYYGSLAGSAKIVKNWAMGSGEREMFFGPNTAMSRRLAETVPIKRAVTDFLSGNFNQGSRYEYPLNEWLLDQVTTPSLLWNFTDDVVGSLDEVSISILEPGLLEVTAINVTDAPSFLKYISYPLYWMHGQEGESVDDYIIFPSYRGHIPGARVIQKYIMHVRY